jgi:hypothetical protein
MEDAYIEPKQVAIEGLAVNRYNTRQDLIRMMNDTLNERGKAPNYHFVQGTWQRGAFSGVFA